MSSIWNNNIDAFKKRFPALYTLYEPAIKKCGGEAPSFWTISEAKSKAPTAEENGIRLHSSYNPQKEARSAVSQEQAQERGTAIFLGFGLGYQAIEWARAYPQKRLILIEPDTEHFFQAMKLVDWTSVFAVKRLIIAAGCPENDIIPLIEQQDTDSILPQGASDAFVFRLQAFTGHAQKYFDNIIALIERNQSKNDINAATYKKFASLWINNSMSNLKQLCRCPTVAALRQSLDAEIKERSMPPFLITAAGPSLQGILPHLAELKQRMIIICVETALPSLLRTGTEPDFIVLSDPQFWAYRHIAGLESPSSVLVTECSVYPAVFRFNCKNTLLCSSNFPIGHFFEDRTRAFGDLGAGGSVASTAWNLAHFLGAEKIFVAGLDLAFPGKQTHIKGSTAEQTFHTVATRLSTAEAASARALLGANPVWEKDFSGSPVLTDSRMKMFAWWFESRLSAVQGVQTFTLCPRGLEIPGIRVQSLEDALTLPELSKRISTEALEPALAESDLLTLKRELSEGLCQLESQLKKIIQLLQENKNPGEEISALAKNPLSPIVRLAAPSAKELEKERDRQPPELAPEARKQLAACKKCLSELARYSRLKI